MRILITGDRNWYDPGMAEAIVARLIARYGPAVLIVHGGATGVDRAFAEAAEACGVDQEAHHAHWEELDHPEAVIRYDAHGRAYNSRAGPIRNAEMVSLGAGLCIALHRSIGRSRGTKDCARRAAAAGIPTWLIDSDEAEPKRLRGDDPRLR